MKLVFISVSLFLLIGCSGQGTNTGNPDLAAIPNIGGNGETVQILQTALCAKYAACFSSSSTTVCTAQIPSLANFTDEIALNPPYATLEELEVAYLNQSFIFNKTSLDLCINAISTLSCSDPLITGSYSTSTPNDYSSIYKLFRASSQCLSLKY